jgi:two-component system sensor histidine kinase KdpD
MKERRLKPDQLLKTAQEEERNENRGKLKIYLGAAPGVGKTYTMLHDAEDELNKGLDIVIGVIESHGRKDIDTMLSRFEKIKHQTVHYHEKELEEFDLDAALNRHPGLILMDEMAHTNAPGVRHKKRWQDIKELLDRGIDVYTTLNVQHIESISDDAAQIINAPVHETIPDSMIEMADTIELVDIPPEELLERLHEGKVYFPDQAKLAADQFFRKGNLIALRELALRVTAERVGAQVLLYRQGQGIEHIWPSRDRILVCVGSRPESRTLIRAAKQFVTALQASWIVVHVETPTMQGNTENRHLAIENLQMAEKLGAETRILTGTDIVKEIMSFAREQNVTQIMIWKHIHKRWWNFFSRSLADEIVRYCGEINVYIMTGELSKEQMKKLAKPKKGIAWKYYLMSLGIVSVATGIDFMLYQHLATSNIVMVYLLAVTIVALFGQMGPSIMASIVSVLAFDFFFVPPLYSFFVADVQYVFTMLVMLTVAQIISQLTVLTRRQAESARFAEQQTSALYRLSRQLASTRGIDNLLHIGCTYIGNVFDSKVIALMPIKNHLTVRAVSRTTASLDDKEMGIAQWVFELGQIAGLGTDSLSFSKALYLPLEGTQGTIGVLRVEPNNPDTLEPPEQRHLLETCAHQIALALEVDRLQEQAKVTELKVESERVREAVLNTFSHDLRSPLVAILGAASTQIEMADQLDPIAVSGLAADIYFEAEQLNRVINNLLQITHLESSPIKLSIQLQSLKDTIKLILDKSRKKLAERKVILEIPEILPLIPFDSALIKEVLINLLDNAIKFSPHKTPIEIHVIIEIDCVVVSIRDHGRGINYDEINMLFEKFYRGRSLTQERGLGLGLAICYSIIKAHNGDIWAENAKDGGSIFYFSLPLSNSTT